MKPSTGWSRTARRTGSRSFVDGLVGDKVYVELLKFTRAVQTDPHHQVRQSIDKYLTDLAQDLQHDPAMIARAEGIKAQVLGDPEVRELASRTWGTIKNALLTAVDDPDSELTVKFKAAVRDFGARLVNDDELAGKVNAWIGDAAGYLVRTYRSDIAGVITDTVARWDAEETSQKIELQVGKDLQFIRINGTVVGPLAGLAIFTVAHLSSASPRQAPIEPRKRIRWPGRAWPRRSRSARRTTAITG